MSASGRPTLDDKINAAGLGWYQARLFAMLSLIVIADGMEMTVLTMLRAPAMREFGIDEYGFAVLGSVIFGGMLVGSLAGGAIADLYGRRTAMLMAGTAFCVFGVGSALAPDLYSFAFARVLTGFGVGGMVPVADSLLLEWSPTQWRSKLVMSMIGVAFAMGSILAAGSGILLYETLGGGEGSVWWRVLLMVCTVPGLISLPWMFFALPESGHFLMTNGLPLSFPPSLSSLSLSLSHTLSHTYICMYIHIYRPLRRGQCLAQGPRAHQRCGAGR
jgi:putative MFS transporter